MHPSAATRSLDGGAWGVGLLTQPLHDDGDTPSATRRLLAIESPLPRSRWRHLLELALDELRWDPRHQALAAHPFFAGCSRQEIRRIARMGDFIEVGRGEVLWRKWQIGYWFLVVFAGIVELRDGRAVDRAGPGALLGGDTILSFGPHHRTARTHTAVSAFVIGRRHLLGLADNPLLRERLGLPAEASAYASELRQMRARASDEWRHIPDRNRGRVKPEHFPANFRVYERARPPAPLVPPSRAPSPAAGPPAPLSRRAIATAVAVVLAAITAVLLLYEPRVAVVRPYEAIDVMRDIRVEGVETYPVSGRYLLLSVRFDRPSLGGLIVAKLRGERTVSLASDDTSGATAYRNSRTTAIAAAAKAAGTDVGDLDVTIRDRELSGPSAGLVYALALRDLLDPDDPTFGRTVAVTGGLTAGGDVYPVWFVREKAGVVRSAEADLFIVPHGQEPAAGRVDASVVGVRSIDEALAALRAA